MHANSSMHAAGFTLMEVLAALVIISLGMLGVIEAVGLTASSATRMRDRTIAHWVGMNRLTAVRLEPRAPKIDETSDEVEMAGRRWRWTMEVTETPVRSMLRIDIRVAAADADEDASLVSVTGFYGTAIAPMRAGASAWQAIPQEGPPGTDPPGSGDGDQQPNPNQEPNPEPAQPDPGGEPVEPPVNETPQEEQ